MSRTGKSTQPLPGFRDFYPEDFAVRAHIADVWRRVARRFAFQEYDGPPLEPLELYTQKSGDEIVGQLYAFEDKGGRAVTLRPEMTPTFARMVGARAQTLRKPVRWFSLPQLFRYERAQKGRLREHIQLNVDIVGEREVLADAELLALAVGIMHELGLSARDVQARVSDRRLLNALLTALDIAPAAWTAVYAVLDKLERQPRDVSRAKLVEAGLDDAQSSDVLALSAMDFGACRQRFAGADVAAEPLARMAEYLSLCAAQGIGEWVRFDLTIVRGLAYYTGIVFELFDAIGEFRAICGGGRYDGLLEAVGGTDLPALGFGMGDVVLGELLKARGLLPQRPTTDVWWIAQRDDADDFPQGMVAVARSLRAADVPVEFALRSMRIEKQLEAARKAGARGAIVLEGTADARRYRVRSSDGDRELSSDAELLGWVRTRT